MHITILGLLSVAAMGYTSSGSVDNSIVPQSQHRPYWVRNTYSATNDENQSHGTVTHRSYDLGLGKNKPVLNGRKVLQKNAVYASSTIDEATRFLVDHEATRKYPSPPRDVPKQQYPQEVQVQLPISQLHESLESVASGTPTKNNGSGQHKIRFERKQKDSLHIFDHGLLPSSIPFPTIVPTSENYQLDINTVWVEMFIHNQQKNFGRFVC